MKPHWLMLSPSVVPVAVSPVLICIIGTHWMTTGATGTLGCHWTTLAHESTQWSPSGNPVVICIIGTHWKTTGRKLATNNYFSSGIPVYTGSKFQVQWIVTGLPLKYHWLRVSPVAPPLPWASVHWLVQCTLECQWDATGWPSVHWDTTGPPSEYLQATLEHYWKNLVESAPHWDATGKTLNFEAYCDSPHTPGHI